MIRHITAIATSLTLATGGASCGGKSNTSDTGKIESCAGFVISDIARERHKLCVVVLTKTDKRKTVELEMDSPCDVGSRWPSCDN